MKLKQIFALFCVAVISMSIMCSCGSKKEESKSANATAKTDSKDSTTTTKSKHKFVNGICSECGLADKEHAKKALSTLIKKNGEKEDGLYQVVKIKGIKAYSISYDEKENDIMLIYIDNVNKDKCKGCGIIIPHKNNNKLNIAYFDKEDNEYHSTLKTSSYTADSDIKLQLFDGSKEEKSKAEKFTKEKCKLLMPIFNDFLKSTKSGLTIQDFGFESYKF